MRFLLALALALFAALPALADMVVAARTLRAQSVIGPDDVALVDGTAAGVHVSLDDVIGLETRVAVYAGRPLRTGEVGPPALVARNQIVPLVYKSGGLMILAEGRSLGRAGLDEIVRVMNLASRQTVSGRVQADGTIIVGGAGISPLTH